MSSAATWKNSHPVDLVLTGEKKRILQNWKTPNYAHSPKESFHYYFINIQK
jgi:hypothetical protein